ncbi:unnamed protein product [Bursaphelenchus xylophilus]|uniref:(pine wood nematode) hypothetical protein n=1 Tax=Bursaphelenchus xylophilus TaxID=6326 RepID=A0A1I7SC76_BURXY|nr:unnamed protein product [Bursaphelenchus xylophilus]CAG9094611.1 unnamed protein product [Bursaphelenchus xylophilus]
MDLREIYPEICFVVTVISLSLSSLVIFLSYRVQKGSRQREYSWILAFNAGVDVYYSLTHGIVVPSAIATTSTGYLTIRNPYLQNIPTTSTQVAVFFQLVAVLCSAPCSAVHFYYRYRLLCKGDIWSKRRYLGAYGVALAVIFLIATLFCAAGNLANERSKVELMSVVGAVDIVYPHVFVTLRDPIFMLCMFLCQLMFVVEYGIIIFCGQRIIRHAQQGTSAAISTQKAQKHLITVMILQAVYPLILYFLPFMYVSILLSTGVKFQNASYIAGISLQLLSPLNSISVLTLIPAYRRALTIKYSKTSGTPFSVA